MAYFVSDALYFVIFISAAHSFLAKEKIRIFWRVQSHASTTLRAEKRTNKFNPHMTPRLEIESGPHWWGASPLTTTSPLLFKINSIILI